MHWNYICIFIIMRYNCRKNGKQKSTNKQSIKISNKKQLWHSSSQIKMRWDFSILTVSGNKNLTYSSLLTSHPPLPFLSAPKPWTHFRRKMLFLKYTIILLLSRISRVSKENCPVTPLNGRARNNLNENQLWMLSPTLLLHTHIPNMIPKSEFS